jgi:hypothetical protein
LAVVNSATPNWRNELALSEELRVSQTAPKPAFIVDLERPLLQFSELTLGNRKKNSFT